MLLNQPKFQSFYSIEFCLLVIDLLDSSDEETNSNKAASGSKKPEAQPMDEKMDSTDSTESNNQAYCFKEWDIKESDLQRGEKLLNTFSGDFDTTKTKSEFEVKIKSFNMGPYVNKASSSVRFSQLDGINFKLIGIAIALIFKLDSFLTC